MPRRLGCGASASSLVVRAQQAEQPAHLAQRLLAGVLDHVERRGASRPGRRSSMRRPPRACSTITLIAWRDHVVQLARDPRALARRPPRVPASHVALERRRGREDALALPAMADHPPDDARAAEEDREERDVGGGDRLAGLDRRQRDARPRRPARRRSPRARACSGRPSRSRARSRRGTCAGLREPGDGRWLSSSITARPASSGTSGQRRRRPACPRTAAPPRRRPRARPRSAPRWRSRPDTARRPGPRARDRRGAMIAPARSRGHPNPATVAPRHRSRERAAQPPDRSRERAETAPAADARPSPVCDAECSTRSDHRETP